MICKDVNLTLNQDWSLILSPRLLITEFCGRPPVEPNGRRAEGHKMRFKAQYFCELRG